MKIFENNHQQAYTLVVGLGVTGLSVVRYLMAKNKNVKVIDSREKVPGEDILHKEFPQLKLIRGGFDVEVFQQAEKIILSPGVALAEPIVQEAIVAGVEVIGDVELFAQQNKKPVIAITGSNGKSSVTTLVGLMAVEANIKVVVGGNLGEPVLDLLKQNAELYVLELSSFQLETTHSLKTVASTVLNISEDHMDRYDSLSAYFAAKQKIFTDSQNPIVNRQDSRVLSMMSDNLDALSFGLNAPDKDQFGLRKVNNKMYLCKGEEQIIAVEECKLKDRHHLANALASLALGDAAGIPMKAMVNAIKEFGGLPHRTQWVAKKYQRNWINDSKATNVGATLAALEGVDVQNKLVLIAGGLAKDADFSPLKNILHNTDQAITNEVRAVVLMGKDAQKIAAVTADNVQQLFARDMNDAVQLAAEISEVGDTVLLSPACASFDMFKNFEDRGEQFIQAVAAL